MGHRVPSEESIDIYHHFIPVGSFLAKEKLLNRVFLLNGILWTSYINQNFGLKHKSYQFKDDTVDGRNPAPSGLYKIL